MSNMLTGMSDFYNNVWLDLRQRPGVGRIDGWRNPLYLLTVWNERQRLRTQLAQMAEHAPELLDDMGLSKTQVHAEIGKPFWRR
ncbi:DUF1127 domain-containing protein [Ensifer sp. IC3342]|nr:DUF1127 domain-containing protein [Ensifer sp. BRP08]MCA1447057.1 DUF1127 domain-containing protein [Ensifer sp. IC3342]